MNGSLDSNFLIGKFLEFSYSQIRYGFWLIIFLFFNNMFADVIGQPIDIGDIQVVPVQGKETKKLEFTLIDTE